MGKNRPLLHCPRLKRGGNGPGMLVASLGVRVILGPNRGAEVVQKKGITPAEYIFLYQRGRA